MPGKKKLAQFAELDTFNNVLQVPFDEVYKKPHSLKGKWAQKVFKNDAPIILELGCGKGEYSVGLASQYPDKNFVGVDIKGARMWRGAKTAIEKNITNVHFLRTRIELINSFFEKGEVSEIWITFPDPQMKDARENKRLTSPTFMFNYFNCLKPDGLIHLKTDSRFLYDYTEQILGQLPVNKEISTSNLYKDLPTLNLTEKEKDILSIPTFYEIKFKEIGHEICYLKLKLIGSE